MSRLSDLIYTDLIEALCDSNTCQNDRQAHAVCLAISRAFSPDRPDSFTAGQQAERSRILALVDLRMEQLKRHPREKAELQLLRAAILESEATSTTPAN